MEKILAFIDNRVAEAYRHEAERLYKARFLVALILTYEALMLGICIWLLTIAPVVMVNAFWSVLLILGMMAGYGYVLYCLKHRNNYQFCIEASVFSAFMGIVVGIAISGGPIQSPATPLMVLPIVLAFSLSTRKSGLVWSFLVLAIHVGMIAVEKWWFTFPQFLLMEYISSYHVAHWAVTYVALVALMLIFETTTARLKAERDEERDKFKYLAAHDPLTGLANRSMFEEELDRAIARCKRNKTQLAILFIDLDGFKPINDGLGHDAGDVVLKSVGDRLRNILRANDAVARMGGDEFAIIIEGINFPSDAEKIAEKMIHAINEPYPALNKQMPVGASIGISIYPDHSQDPIELHKQADMAMYKAKERKNTTAVFSDAIREEQMREVS